MKCDPELTINRVASLESAGPGDIAYLSDRKYLAKLAKTAAGAVIVTEADASHFSGPALIVNDPHLCFARVAQFLNPFLKFSPGVHATAVIESGAQVAATAWIGPHSVVEAGAKIGDDAFVGPGCFIGKGAELGARNRLIGHVTIGERCVFGTDCVIYPGAVIGGDGFGFARNGERWQKVPQLGRVVMGNDVEVGANTTIDRGALDDTVIGNGVKLDNLIQIAHNVQIGDNTAIAACVGIAGSTIIGQRCTLGGQSGIVGHLEITDDVHVTAGSLVTSSIREAGVYSSSLKAMPVDKWRRNAAVLHRLEEMSQRLRKIEESLELRSKEHKN
ncbi:MAG: UDP-3-O-(3-hydroxymyristoyl)glucosamine N-acyltransferase [Gammaproteobacteria bacterium]|nr:UDP-3-O-(3-hydroxymyristoyl)glucosamine N-acyltransferase [Gammaproteobacteria bacterium]